MVSTLLSFLSEHCDLIELLYDAIVNQGLTKEQAKQAIRDSLVAAADAEMRAKYPDG